MGTGGVGMVSIPLESLNHIIAILYDVLMRISDPEVMCASKRANEGGLVKYFGAHMLRYMVIDCTRVEWSKNWC